MKSKFRTGARLAMPEQISSAPNTQSDESLPKLSVVIPNFNSGKFVENCIRSILIQDYPRCELIVIDGGSTDISLGLIEKYLPHIDYFVSERDGGQTNAINKGLRVATGDLVAWQNADDVYLPGAFSRIASLYKSAPLNTMMFCGNVLMIDSDDQITSVLKGWRPTVRRLAQEGWIISSQGLFWRRTSDGEAFELNESFSHAMDMDLWLRLLSIGNAAHTQQFLGAFRIHPGTKTSVNGNIGTEEFYSLISDYGFKSDSVRYRTTKRIFRISRLLNFYANKYFRGAVRS